MADSFISVMRIGRMMGKLRIAMSVALLFAFTEIALMKVKVIENPTLLKPNPTRKRPISRTGFPTKRLNNPKANKLMNNNIKVLYTILEKRIATGFASV